MSTSAAAMRKRRTTIAPKDENDQNSPNEPQAKKLKLEDPKSDILTMFGPVQTENCFDHPCYGTIDILPNTIVVKCKVCEKMNCVPCKTVHEDLTEICKKHQAKKIDEAFDQEAAFNKLKSEGSNEVAEAEDKKMETEVDSVKEEVEVDPLKIEETKELSVQEAADTTQDFNFKPGEVLASTPFVEASQVKRTRLFEEDEVVEGDSTIAPTPNLSSVSEKTGDENILETTYEQIVDGSKLFICSVCPFKNKNKGAFTRHCKSKKHLDNSMRNESNTSAKNQQ